MCHLEKLERLSLSHNSLSDMPRLLAAFLRRLQVIDLSCNRFKRIPPVLAALTGLQSINLSGNPDLEACALYKLLIPSCFLMHFQIEVMIYVSFSCFHRNTCRA